jgi:hypothetical protein
MMKSPDNFCAQSVGEWLAIATDSLVPTARERIKLEIEGHFADIVAARLAEGLIQEQANKAALVELGDPADAAKGFRKRHLTEEELKWLRKLIETGRRNRASPWNALAVIFLPLFWAAQFHYPDNDLVSFPYRHNAAMALCLYSCSVLVFLRLKFRNLVKYPSVTLEFKRRVLLLNMQAGLLLFLNYLTLIPATMPRIDLAGRIQLSNTSMPLWLFLLIFLLIFISWAANRLPLWRKLRHIHPPQGHPANQ